MNAESRGVAAADGGAPYLLPETSLLAAYAIVAASTHFRLDEWPSAQLKVLAVP